MTGYVILASDLKIFLVEATCLLRVWPALMA